MSGFDPLKHPRQPAGSPDRGKFRTVLQPVADDLVPTTSPSPELMRVLESAALLQQAVPGTVIVGGSAAAYWAHHRLSYDHDHVYADLAERYDDVLASLESNPDWRTSKRATRKPWTIMGSFSGVQAGVRHLRRTRPIETASVVLPSGNHLCLPTAPETLRIKAYLVTQRCQVRDFLDIAALADHIGYDEALDTLDGIEDYYDTEQPGELLTDVTQALWECTPADSERIGELSSYKGLDPSWGWERIKGVCQDLGQGLAQ